MQRSLVSTSAPTLLVHRLHNCTYDSCEDRTTARAANGIAEKAAQRSARSRISTRSALGGYQELYLTTPPDRTAYDLEQRLISILQDRTDSLTAEDASNNLNNNRKNCFPRRSPLKFQNTVVPRSI
jgi:hypothetical protein